jgi:amidase
MYAAEYQWMDALELSALLRNRQVTALELMDCAINLAKSRGVPLNALCYERFEESRSLAAGAEVRGVFGAVPFLLKDSALPSKRFASSLGSRLLKGMSFKFDATLLERFDAAGLIPFARTTVPEFCMAPTTEAAANGGPTLNPWDRSHSAGGSSGGAAAAVAARIVPLAHANDGGGSIRIPASCCGVFGLKPSRGLTPLGPSRGEGWGGLAVEGVISRSVRDTAAALDAVAGYESGAPYAAPARPASYCALLTEPFEQPLRIARWTHAWNDIALHPECVTAVDRVVDVLRARGHEVTDTPPPPIDYPMFIEALIDVLATNAHATVQAFTGGQAPEEWRASLEPALYDACEIGRSVTAARYVSAINTFHSVGRRIARHLAGFDLALTPTLAQPPLPLGTLRTDTDFRSFRRAVSKYTPFLPICNASGQPAASVPVHWTPTGLPVGVQLIGQYGREDLILRVAADLEIDLPWRMRHPQP